MAVPFLNKPQVSTTCELFTTYNMSLIVQVDSFISY